MELSRNIGMTPIQHINPMIVTLLVPHSDDSILYTFVAPTDIYSEEDDKILRLNEKLKDK